MQLSKIMPRCIEYNKVSFIIDFSYIKLQFGFQLQSSIKYIESSSKEEINGINPK